MANIASATVTLRGTVASRVVSLTANGVRVTLTGTSFAHAVTFAPGAADKLVILTTIDDEGRSESRTVSIANDSAPYVPPAPV